MLVPPDEDIHVVENCGSELAISVHVYGDDIGLHGTSVNRVFPEELARADVPSTGFGVSWRELDVERRAA